jgi:sugar phosphate isomerase/epimerase
VYLSIRDAILTLAGYGTLQEGLQNLGLEAIELEFGRDFAVMALDNNTPKARWPLTDEAQAIKFAAHAQNLGIIPCVLLLENDLNAVDQNAEIEWVVRAVRAASWLGIKAIRIDSGMREGGNLPAPARIDIAARFIKQVIAATADLPIDMGIENHSTYGNDPEYLGGVIRAVDSPRIGLTLDSGNFYWAGYPLRQIYQLFKQFAPYTKHTHIKNLHYEPEGQLIYRGPDTDYEHTASPIEAGDIDHRELIKELRKVGYDRDICLEDESIAVIPEADRKAVLARDIAHLQRIIEQ